MFSSHLMGEISLWLSSSIYIIWLLPQIIQNYKGKSTQGLSFWFHAMLYIGYCLDLIYGFGLHMEWQYKIVTIAGLINLTIQHWQFWRYGLKKTDIGKKDYYIVSIIVLSLLFFAFSILMTHDRGREFYDVLGLVSTVCFWLYMLPQITKNYLKQSTQGLSHWFIILSIFLGLCDLNSAYQLNWDWPSLFGSSIGLISKFILLFQIYYYRNNHYNNDRSYC